MSMNVRKGFVGLAAVASVIGGSVIAPLTASAVTGDGNGIGARSWDPDKPGRFWGSFQAAGINETYCIDSGALQSIAGGSLEASSWTTTAVGGSEGGTIQRSTDIAADKVDKKINGTSMTNAEIAKLNYALFTWASDDSLDTKLALAEYVRSLTASDRQRNAPSVGGIEYALDGGNALNPGSNTLWGRVVAKHPGALTKLKGISAAADKYAGPYTVDVTWKTQPTASTAGVAQVKVTSASGNAVPNVAVAWTVKGVAATSPTTSKTGADGLTTVSLAADPTGGTNTVVATINAASESVLLLTPNGTGSGNTQRMVVPRAEAYTDRVTNSPTPLNPDGHSQVSTANGDQKAKPGESIRDTIFYQDLTPGTAYKWTSAMYKMTGATPDIAKDALVPGSKSTADYVAPKATGSAAWNLTIPTDAKPNDVYYVTEVVTDANGKEVFSDVAGPVAQRITIEALPIQIGTTAVDAADKDKNVLPAGTVLDTVNLTGLTAGQDYTLKAELMVRNPDGTVKGQVLEDGTVGNVNQGNPLEVLKPFTAGAANGTQSMQIKLPASLAGMDIVVYETLYNGKDDSTAPISSHRNINDTAQLVHVGGKVTIGTQAADDADGDNYFVIGKDLNMIDTIAYDGLVEGGKYTATAVLKDAKGNDLKGVAPVTVPFTAEKGGKGTVKVEGIKVPGSVTAEVQQFTVFESVKEVSTGTVVGEHTDLSDTKQTMYGPSGRTKASDKLDGDKHVSDFTKPSTVVDKVEYFNLIPGKSYTLTGQLMDKETKAPVPGATSEEVTFTASKSGSGTVEMNFNVPALKKSITAVAFETIKDGDKPVFVHADINDAPQTVSFPGIGTTAKDFTKTDNYISVGESRTVVDKVAYTNLIPGQTYTAKGQLVNPVDGKPVGAPVLKTFTPSTADGSIEVPIPVPAGVFPSLVVFEDVYNGKDATGLLVAQHHDVKSPSQTVYFPKIGTSATDQKDGDKYLQAGQDGVIKDVVKYDGLIPGKSYTVKGELLDKSTGKATGVVGQTTFTATKTAGTVDVTFKVPADKAGILVVAETIYEGNVKVADHRDINDKEQTVYKPKVGTSAVDQKDGDKVISHAGGVVVDTVKYEGLQPGKSYTITGELMDKATGKATGIKGSGTFVASKDGKGTAQVTFKVPSGLDGKSLVAFETVLDGKAVVADHKDIKDSAQTVTIDKPGAPVSVHSGINGNTLGAGIAGLSAVALIAGAVAARRKAFTK